MLTQPPNFVPTFSTPAIVQQSIQSAGLRTQAPQTLILSAHLGALAIALQHALKVKRPGGLCSPVSLFIADIIPSSERKSSVYDLILKPIREFAEQERLRIEPRLERYRNEKGEWELDRQQLVRRRLKARTSGLPHVEIDAQLAELVANKPKRPKAFHFVMQNATQEALAKHFHEDHPTLAIVAPEGGVALDSPIFRNLPMANALWSGEDIEISRVTKDPIHIHEPKFTVLLATQESVLKKFLAKKGDLAHDSGFTPRILFAEGTPMRGQRMISGVEHSPEPVSQFHARISQILKVTHLPDVEDHQPYTMTFSTAAIPIWIYYYNDIERAQAPGGYFSDIPAAAGKSAEIAARLSALFQYFEHGPSEISIENAMRGVDLARWYLCEHKRLFGPKPEVPEDERDAILLEQWLRDRCWRYGGCGVFPRNEILKFGPHRLRNRYRREAALLLLTRADRVRIMLHNKTHIVYLNPAVFPVDPMRTHLAPVSAITAPI